jgi:excisionase family DNA binding protein
MGIESLPEVVTVKQLADYLQVNPMTIKRALQKNELVGFKVGKDWRIFREEIAKWLDIKK